MCNQDCIKAYVSTLSIVRKRAGGLDKEFYKLTEEDKKAKNQIVSLKSVDDPIFETGAQEIGACFNKKIEIDGENELRT
jgi:hypothetical protein